VENIGKCLDQIKTSLGTDKLEKEYGFKPATTHKATLESGFDSLSKNSMDVFKTSYTRFWVRGVALSARHSLISKTKWAIRNKAKFEGLQRHLKDFIDGLHEGIPISKESQDLLVQDDMCQIIKISRLRLVQSACSESNYKSEADMASAVIEESTARIVDCRRIED
jgi:hypothetical protein